MRARDYIDLFGGALLLAFGVWYALYAGAEYDAGNMRRMGPGWFPQSLGWLVAIFGVLILVPALFRRGDMPIPKIRPFVTIVVSGLIFAAIVERLGLVPAVLSLVVVSAAAEDRFRPVRTIILAVALATLAVTVFSWGLGIPIPAFRWSQY